MNIRDNDIVYPKRFQYLLGERLWFVIFITYIINFLNEKNEHSNNTNKNKNIASA